MEIKVIHHTTDMYASESSHAGTSLEKQAFLLAGREAGICYMKDDYFDTKINDDESALRRADMIIKSGHHSPFDHYTIGLEITGIPKIMAMILNSTEYYVTSEKSARYTMMKPLTQVEADTYAKWTHIFMKLIRLEAEEAGIPVDEKQIEKFAIENARYMLSVFTPTSMGFTTTFRQLCYLTDWLEDLGEHCKTGEACKDCKTDFYTKISESSLELASKLREIVGDKLHDNKNRKIGFMLQPYGTERTRSYSFKNTYNTYYFGSFAQLAQAQRHRTLHYEMSFSGDPLDKGCYIPSILASDRARRYYAEHDINFYDEWLTDFHRLAHTIPQCSLILIFEQGATMDFLLKCKERLCGRAQLEIAERTASTFKCLHQFKDQFDGDTRDVMNRCLAALNKLPRCAFTGYQCNEPCVFGAKHGLNRKF